MCMRMTVRDSRMKVIGWKGSEEKVGRRWEKGEVERKDWVRVKTARRVRVP